MLVPAGNRTIAQEFRRAAPRDASILVTPLLRPEGTKPGALDEEVADLERNLHNALLRLKEADPDVVVYGCAAGSFVGEGDGDARITAEVRGVVDRPVVMAARASRDALVHLGLTSVGLGTPYPGAVNDALVAYLSAGGLRVKGVETVRYEEVQSGVAVAGLVMRAARCAPDGILLCCTDLPTLRILGRLEQAIGKPVISSNQAALWACLRGRPGTGGRADRWGSLFGPSAPGGARASVRAGARGLPEG